MDSLLAYAQQNASGGSFSLNIGWIISAVGLWKMFEKAGEPGWIGLIPIYNQYKLCEKTMGNPWYWLRLLVAFVPVVGWVAAFYFAYQIGKATARSYGQEETWAWGYTFLAPIFYCITGFGDYKYYGVMGTGDTRTGDARQARTVDFDVVKNEPEVRVNTVDEGVVINDIRPETEAEEAEIEFTFDRSDD